MLLNPNQKTSLKESTDRINLWEGSVRSGKSFAIDLRFLKAIAEDSKGMPPEAIDMMVGKTTASLKRNVINPIINLVGSKDAEYFHGKQVLRIWDKIIHVVGANDERSEGKIRGSTVRKCLGDELTLWPESFFRMLDSRLSTEKSQLFGSTNPATPYHYIKKDYIDKQKDLNVMSFKFILDDNIALKKSSPSYIEAIKKNYTGLWYKRYILGEWCIAEGAVYDFFDYDIHTTDEEFTAEKYIIGVDYGTTNPCAFIVIGVNGDRACAMYEYYFDSAEAQHQKTDTEYANDFIEFVETSLGKDWQEKTHSVYIDPSAKSFKLQLQDSGVYCLNDADNDVLPGISKVSCMMKTGSYKINRRCVNLIKEKYAYSWDTKAQARGIDAPIKKSDHICDAERYALFSYFDESKIPLLYTGGNYGF